MLKNQNEKTTTFKRSMDDQIQSFLLKLDTIGNKTENERLNFEKSIFGMIYQNIRAKKAEEEFISPTKTIFQQKMTKFDHFRDLYIIKNDIDNINRFPLHQDPLIRREQIKKAKQHISHLRMYLDKDFQLLETMLQLPENFE